MNPFLIKSYEGPKYFCDRDKELSDLVSAVDNGRDVMLFSLRRMGKTGLMKHLEYQYKDHSELLFVYFDIYYSVKLSDFVNLFGTAVIKKLEKTPAKIFKRITSFVKSVMPSVQVNPVTMETEINFNIQNEEDARISLEQIFDMIANSKKRIVVAIDEFQQISVYPEKNVEALLRTYIQRTNNMNVIFSGSSKHLLTSMFASQSRPFYQSAQPMELGAIDHEKYIDFIHYHFSSNGKSIDKSDIASMIKMLRSHTYYIQYFCNKLYASRRRKISSELIVLTLKDILKEHEAYYFRFRDLLTDNQFSLIKAVAKEDKIAQPTSLPFLKKHGLPASSTVGSALNVLLNKEFLYKDRGDYFVYDVFFSLWLKSIYH